MTVISQDQTLTKKDFASDVDIRWCPGCGDYAILNAVQKVFPELGIPKENFVVVSGIGCSSRFPYYISTYGLHSIHGRAPTVATGIKVAHPELSVWLVTGDGDGLSIGGNHLLHVLRRNVGIKILLFNNKIYGLTKGQYSPTSEVGKTTKTSPQGSLEYPINPLSFAIAAEATFVARTMDTSPKHMAEILKAAGEHKGTSFVEIMQNCVIFNDKTWDSVSGRPHRDETLLELEDNKPLLFGKNKNKGIRLNNFTPEIVTINENGITEKDLLVHNVNKTNPSYAYMLSQLSHPEFPVPIGVLRKITDRPIYEEQVEEQIKNSKEHNGVGDIQKLIQGTDYWEVTEDNMIYSTINKR